jgi:3-oxoacid CoA-transferase subunit A
MNPIGNIYITGDTHGDFERIEDFCKIFETTKKDVMIILGDAGVNYFLDRRDEKLKQKLEKMPITFMLVRGNHEARPGIGWDKEDAESLFLIDCPEYAGTFMMEQEYPSILYMLDGGVYTFNVRNRQLKALTIGGAYSVDKQYRLQMQSLGLTDYKWFENEQLIEEEMSQILNNVRDRKFDYVLTHTCPLKDEPRHACMPLAPADIDKTMEEFLEKVKNSITYEAWYCGHWHIDQTFRRMNFMYKKVAQLGGMYDHYE